MSASTHPLPFRMAQCRHALLDAFQPEYFEFLKEQGCHAIYLQNSPFDPMQTGNVGQFFDHFHLISLFDISRSHRRREYQNYINEICARAAGYGIQVWLDCWEPRLPAHAQTQLPPSWRGRGGWGWHGRKEIAFCWEHPEAVAFWKSMAKDALEALPGLSGVVISMIDNESSFCDASCPRCEGRSLVKGVVDVFRTFREMAANHPNRLRLAMYDWWIPESLTESMFAELPPGSLVIGRSSRGLAFEPPDALWKGNTTDISNVVDGLSPDFQQCCQRLARRNLDAIDMVAWSRGMENFFLPAPPDPFFAIRKCRSLREAGAVGWMDYDCGCMEPGSLAAGVREWTADPDAAEAVLVRRVLEGIWGREMGELVQPAYELYREARLWMPVGLQSPYVPNLDARGCGFGFCLFSPFFVSDLGFLDTDHAWNYFAPYSLIVEDSLPRLLASTARVVECLSRANEHLHEVPDGRGNWEKAVFEIHWRSFLALHHYVRLASAKWRHAGGEISSSDYQAEVRTIAAAERENLAATEAWHRRHPGQLGNPCHRIRGHLHSAWPGIDFSKDLFEPKRKSLDFLVSQFDPAEFVPAHAIAGNEAHAEAL